MDINLYVVKSSWNLVAHNLRNAVFTGTDNLADLFLHFILEPKQILYVSNHKKGNF